MREEKYNKKLKLGISFILLFIVCQFFSPAPVCTPLVDNDSQLHSALKALHLDRYAEIKYTRHDPNWNGPFWELYHYHPDDCRCISGSEYVVATSRVKESRNVVFYMEGGGACWPGQDECTKEIDRDEVLNGRTIIPLAWNYIYVPYCDGSIHMGDSTVDEDGNGKPDIWHWGLRSTSAAVALMKELYPDPEKILITGISAGGYGTIIATMIIRLHFPRSRLYVLNNAGPGLWNPEDRATWELITKTWNIRQFLPSDCEKCQDQLIYLYDWMLKRDRKLKVGLVTSYMDQVIGENYLQMRPDDFRKLLIGATDYIREKHPDTFKRFFIEGKTHGVRNSYRIKGISLRKWMEHLVNDSEKWIDILE